MGDLDEPTTQDETTEIQAMKNILSYKRTLTIIAVVLTLISLRMHLDPAGITENEFP